MIHYPRYDAGWSSPVARRAHNPKVAGSNPAPATKKLSKTTQFWVVFLYRSGSFALCAYAYKLSEIIPDSETINIVYVSICDPLLNMSSISI